MLIAQINKTMTASTLYKDYKANKKDVESKLASQIALRYQTPADDPENNITNIKHFLSLDQILHTSLFKNVQTSCMVFLACYKFLAKIRRKPKLMNNSNKAHRTASLLIEGYRPPGTCVTQPSSTSPPRQIPDHKAKGTNYHTIRDNAEYNMHNDTNYTSRTLSRAENCLSTMANTNDKEIMEDQAKTFTKIQIGRASCRERV